MSFVYEEAGKSGKGYVELFVYWYMGVEPLPSFFRIVVRSWYDASDRSDYEPHNQIIEDIKGNGDAKAIRRGIELFDSERKKLQGRGDYNLNLSELGSLLNALELRLISEGVDVDDLAGVKLESISIDILKMAAGR